MQNGRVSQRALLSMAGLVVAAVGAFAVMAISAPAEATQPPRPLSAEEQRERQGAVPSAGFSVPRASGRNRLREILGYVSTRGLTSVTERASQARSASRARAAAFRKGINAGPPITRPTAVEGTWKIPVVMLKYADTAASPYPVANLKTQLFDGPWPTGTMTDYYREVSHGKLNVTGTLTDWITLSKRGAVYTGPPGCAGINCDEADLSGFLLESLTAVDRNIDFTEYDNDGPDGVPNSGDDDGFVDFIALVHPETGGECQSSGSGIWSHRWSVTNATSTATSPGRSFETNDVGRAGAKIRIDDYVVMPALACGGRNMIEIGVFAHEFGHAFGLPDLYDIDYSSRGISGWGLMGGGSWGGDGNTPQTPSHMSAWSKEYLGWQQSLEISQDTKDVTLLPASQYRSAVRVDIDSDKAFLIEYREKRGFDKSLAGAGLVVWRIKNSVVTAGLRTNRVNANDADRGIAVIEADGRSDLLSPLGRADDGDVFPGSANKVALDSTGTPTTEGAIALCNIRRHGEAVVLDIYVSRSTCAETAVVTLSSNLLFGYKESVVKPSAYADLGRVADRIKASTGPRVVVHGHTDSVGSRSSNEALSLERAEAVKSWLVETGGVSGSIVTTVAHGETKLVSANGKPVTDASDEDPARSRRVEIEVMAARLAPAR